MDKLYVAYDLDLSLKPTFILVCEKDQLISRLKEYLEEKYFEEKIKYSITLINEEDSLFRVNILERYEDSDAWIFVYDLSVREFNLNTVLEF